MEQVLRIGVVGGGMFFDEIIGPTLMDFQGGGFAGALGSIGMSCFAREVAGIRVEVAAVGTRSRARGTADRIRSEFLRCFPETPITAYYGDDCPHALIAGEGLDVLFVAGPDHLHHAVILDALEAGVHVITEKPMCLRAAEADAVITAAARTGLVVAVDMHKRYDPFVRHMMTHSLPLYNRIYRVRAVLEEPLAVATEVFQWVEQSNPFAYVGCHWLDVVAHYMGVKPRTLYASGARMLLENWDRYVREIAILRGRDPATFRRRDAIHAWDALSVNITYDNGMRGDFDNAWINPAEFEGAVNQEIEVYGVLGRGFVDQQDRGFRETITGDGSRTRNPAFGGRVRGGSGREELYGYGKASIAAGLLAISRVKFLGEKARDLAGTYPDAPSQHCVTQIIEAATVVAERNDMHFRERGLAPVTAALTEDRTLVLDPIAGDREIYRRSEL
ncbi:MAG: Gfo/Idh/MocA family oxidoreductase [Lentisphaeria bacterium]|nr:Gfo/Idh/MocA family oxidoreductase [Lentisphaeria bacterium]